MRESLIQTIREKRWIRYGSNDKDIEENGSSVMLIHKDDFLKDGQLLAIFPHNRYSTTKLHRHDFIEIMYVCDGQITHCVGDKEIVMKKGRYTAHESMGETSHQGDGRRCHRNQLHYLAGILGYSIEDASQEKCTC